MCKDIKLAVWERCLKAIRRGNRPLFLILAFVFAISICLPGHPDAPPVQKYDMLRFHVRAHNNGPGEQRIKNFVAQKVLDHFRPEWSRCRSSEELSFLLAENSTALEDAARKILEKCGCTHDVQVSLTREVFPARCYEGKLYPPGEYAALYLVIGEGRGENWWCVLFPPLCFSATPFMTEDDEELYPLHPGNNPQTGKYGGAVTQAAAAAEGRDNLGGEKPSCRWRFWLWEVLKQKNVGQNVETARPGPDF